MNSKKVRVSSRSDVSSKMSREGPSFASVKKRSAPVGRNWSSCSSVSDNWPSLEHDSGMASCQAPDNVFRGKRQISIGLKTSGIKEIVDKTSRVSLQAKNNRAFKAQDKPIIPPKPKALLGCQKGKNAFEIEFSGDAFLVLCSTYVDGDYDITVLSSEGVTMDVKSDRFWYVCTPVLIADRKVERAVNKSESWTLSMLSKIVQSSKSVGQYVGWESEQNFGWKRCGPYGHYWYQNREIETSEIPTVHASSSTVTRNERLLQMKNVKVNTSNVWNIRVKKTLVSDPAMLVCLELKTGNVVVTKVIWRETLKRDGFFTIDFLIDNTNGYFKEGQNRSLAWFLITSTAFRRVSVSIWCSSSPSPNVLSRSPRGDRIDGDLGQILASAGTLRQISNVRIMCDNGVNVYLEGPAEERLDETEIVYLSGTTFTTTNEVKTFFQIDQGVNVMSVEMYGGFSLLELSVTPELCAYFIGTCDGNNNYGLQRNILAAKSYLRNFEFVNPPDPNLICHNCSIAFGQEHELQSHFAMFHSYVLDQSLPS